MTAEPRDIRERVALAMGWRQAGNGKEWINPRTGLRVKRPPRITEHAAFEMLREMGPGGIDMGQYAPMTVPHEWYYCHWDDTFTGEGDTLEHAIAECWLAVKAAQEVRE